MSPTLPPLRAFRTIPGFRGYYASYDGHIFSCRRKGPGNRGLRLAFLTERISRKGYYLVDLEADDGDPKAPRGRRRTVKVHTLICLAWYGPPPEGGLEVCHGNNDKRDNRAKNLRWDTQAGNRADRRPGQTPWASPAWRASREGFLALTDISDFDVGGSQPPYTYGVEGECPGS